MNILVTGGAGYIGSHTVKALARQGFTPVIYDNFSTGHRWAIQGHRCEEGDINDQARLQEVMQRHAIKAVIHFAALTEVGASMRDPARYYRNNVVGTLSLLEAMRECNILPIVFSSSCAVYGVPDTLPIIESAPKKPISPYGATKWACEQLLADFGSAYGLRWAALRYFNAAGADPDGVLGEDHTPETHLIPLILDVALGRRAAINVYGNDYPTTDGSCIRDYIHVNDLADAHVLTLKKLLADETALAINLGTGHGLSVMELINAARAITGKPIPLHLAERRPGDPPILYSDPSYAQNFLEWRPQRSDIDSILRDAWQWHGRHFM